MTATLCAHRDCPTIVPRSGYCPDAKPKTKHGDKHGRDTRHWRRFTAQRKELDVYRCQRCGGPNYLTAHLHPSLGGNHRAATIDDVVTLRRSCHGRTDAPRGS